MHIHRTYVTARKLGFPALTCMGLLSYKPPIFRVSVSTEGNIGCRVIVIHPQRHPVLALIASLQKVTFGITGCQLNASISWAPI